MAETRTNTETPTKDAQDLRDAFHQLGNLFFDVRARLWQLEALFATLSGTDTLEIAATDELVYISNLVDMGRDVAKLGDDSAEVFHDALDKLEDRLFRQPQAGDAMPLEIAVQMLGIAAWHKPTDDSEEMCRRVQMLNTLKDHFLAAPTSALQDHLGDALEAWIAMLESQGAELHLVPWKSGYEQWRYNRKPGFGPQPQRRMRTHPEEAKAST